jgi:hypothetical protein
MDPAPDPAILVFDLEDANKKLFIFLLSLNAYYFLKVHFFVHHFLKVKSHSSQNSRNQGFSYYFCLMIDDPDPGSRRQKNNGSGSATLIAND